MKKLHKLGLTKSYALLLFLQMILLLSGLCVSFMVLLFLIQNKLGMWNILATSSVFISFLMLIFYGIFGFRRNKIFILISIFLFAASIFINAILPYRDITQRGLLIMLFGLTLIIPFILENSLYSRFIPLLAVIISLGFSIYATTKANVNSLGEVNSINYATVIMYMSIYSPVILSSTIALITNRTYLNAK